jgi:adenosine deaminase
LYIDDFIDILPKAELHLHFEGAVPWRIVQAHAPEPLPDVPPWWADDFRFDDFDHFLIVIRQCYQSALISVERYYDAAYALFQDLQAQNVRYIELSFALNFAHTRQLPLPDLIAAIKHAAPADMVVRVYAGISRSNTYTLDNPLIQAMFDTPGLDGIDLHGDERACGPAPFAPMYAHARQRGLAVKAHAGELAGPHAIIDTLDALGVRRIEHGTTAIHDEALMIRLASEGITLDMCPSSNAKLRVVDLVTAHPIRELHRRGIPVTVNTDDPTVFGCTLTDELRLLAEHLDFSPNDLAQLQRNAFLAADLPAAIRKAALADIDALVAQINYTDLQPIIPT